MAALSVFDMLIRPSPPLPSWSYDQGKPGACLLRFFRSRFSRSLAVSVLCKPFLGPCHRLSSVGSRATEDLQGTALVQLRPPNGGYLGQMGVAKGGSCLSACGFASEENRCNAPRPCRYWLTGAHRYLARSSTDWLLLCRPSPETATGPHTLGFAERARLQKRSGCRATCF